LIFSGFFDDFLINARKGQLGPYGALLSIFQAPAGPIYPDLILKNSIPGPIGPFETQFLASKLNPRPNWAFQSSISSVISMKNPLYYILQFIYLDSIQFSILESLQNQFNP